MSPGIPGLPIIPGHEIIGSVDKLGPGVIGPVVGTRVGIPWLASTCGHCRYCKAGKENLCENIRFTGFHVDGGYARYTLVRAGFCYPVPRRFADAEAAPLMCAGVIGLRALRLAGMAHDELRMANDRPRLGLYGFGASAHICLQIARHWHCEVAVFTRADKHAGTRANSVPPG
jgi:propanol-preferring alcohol dehydrogenase